MTIYQAILGLRRGENGMALKEIILALKRQGIKVTAQRRAILEYLKAFIIVKASPLSIIICMSLKKQV